MTLDDPMTSEELRLLKPGDHVRASSGNLYRVRHSSSSTVKGIRIRDDGLPYGAQRRLNPNKLTLVRDLRPLPHDHRPRFPHVQAHCRHSTPDVNYARWQPSGYLVCLQPSWIAGYDVRQEELPPDGVHVENDEGWAFRVGPDFGCIHFEKRALPLP